jgi:hypothetical protein
MAMHARSETQAGFYCRLGRRGFLWRAKAFPFNGNRGS